MAINNTVPTNLNDYYTGKGQALPSLASRGQLYQQYGLGNSNTYTGSAQQNTSLLGKLSGSQSGNVPLTSQKPGLVGNLNNNLFTNPNAGLVSNQPAPKPGASPFLTPNTQGIGNLNNNLFTNPSGGTPTANTGATKIASATTPIATSSTSGTNSGLLTQGQSFQGGTVNFDRNTGQPLSAGQTTTMNYNPSLANSNPVVPPTNIPQQDTVPPINQSTAIGGSTTTGTYASPSNITASATQPTATSSNNTTQTPPPVTYPGLVNTLGNFDPTKSAGYQEAQKGYEGAVSNLSEFNQNLAKANAGIESTPIPLEFQQGRAQVLNRQAASQQQALQGAVNQQQAGLGYALTGSQQQLGALGTAAGLAAPITGVPYGTQNINPLNGQSYGGGQGGGTNVDPNNPMASIPSLADAVINGQMTIDQANSALGGNIGMTTNLRNQILSKNKDFNFTQSSASAATQAVGQQVNTYSNSANAALDKLTSDFAALPDWQKLGVPGSIGIEQAIGQFFGNAKLATYQTTLHDARAQLTGVLSTAGGMTPTSAEDTAKTYLPDNMTKDQLPAKIAAAKALVAQKVQAFQSSGKQSNANTNQSTTGLYNF